MYVQHLVSNNICLLSGVLQSLGGYDFFWDHFAVNSCLLLLLLLPLKKNDMRAVREVQVIKLEEAQLSNAQKTFDVYMAVPRHKCFFHYLRWNAFLKNMDTFIKKKWIEKQIL